MHVFIQLSARAELGARSVSIVTPDGMTMDPEKLDYRSAMRVIKPETRGATPAARTAEATAAGPCFLGGPAATEGVAAVKP